MVTPPMVRRLEKLRETAKDERRVPPGWVAAAEGRGPFLWRGSEEPERILEFQV
jgi:hypothetical protein